MIHLIILLDKNHYLCRMKMKIKSWNMKYCFLSNKKDGEAINDSCDSDIRVADDDYECNGTSSYCGNGMLNKDRKGLIGLIISIVLLFACASCGSAKKAVAVDKDVKTFADNEFSPSVLIISYDGETGKDSLMSAVKDYKAELIYDYKNFNAIAIRIPKGADINVAIRYFEKVKGVIMVQRDRICHID